MEPVFPVGTLGQRDVGLERLLDLGAKGGEIGQHPPLLQLVGQLRRAVGVALDLGIVARTEVGNAPPHRLLTLVALLSRRLAGLGEAGQFGLVGVGGCGDGSEFNILCEQTNKSATKNCG